MLLATKFSRHKILVTRCMSNRTSEYLKKSLRYFTLGLCLPDIFTLGSVVTLKILTSSKGTEHVADRTVNVC